MTTAVMAPDGKSVYLMIVTIINYRHLLHTNHNNIYWLIINLYELTLFGFLNNSGI